MVVYFLSARDMSKTESFVFAESQFYSTAFFLFIQKIIMICIVAQNLNQIFGIFKGWKSNFIINCCGLFLYFKDILSSKSTIQKCFKNSVPGKTPWKFANSWNLENRNIFGPRVQSLLKSARPFSLTSIALFVANFYVRSRKIKKLNFSHVFCQFHNYWLQISNGGIIVRKRRAEIILKICMTIIKAFILWLFEVRDEDRV